MHKFKHQELINRVRAFYERNPFPDYQGQETISDFMQKARKGVFARLLNEQVPFNVRILDVGCGTGQLTNFLSIAKRTVFGTDISFNSLRLAEEFRRRNNLENAGFYQMDLFRPIFKEESFHLLICNGVLHHTGNASEGFRIISRLVKKGGYIIIGLYNKYGRIITKIRRFIFNISCGGFKFLDPQLIDKDKAETKKSAWFLDQYRNPYESSHSAGEVLRWFDENNFDFINSIPKLKLLETFSEQEKLFSPASRGNSVDRFFAQFYLLLKGAKEGGFFLMIGRRKNQ